MKALLTAVALALAPAAATIATPAAAQDLPYSYGNYWDVTGVTVEDAGAAQYIDFLASNWKKQQEFAKSKGWISGYHVLSNLYKRPGEPDIYLVTIYAHFPDAAESTARDKAYNDYFKTTMRKSIEESAGRATWRKIISSEFFQEMILK